MGCSSYREDILERINELLQILDKDLFIGSISNASYEDIDKHEFSETIKAIKEKIDAILYDYLDQAMDPNVDLAYINSELLKSVKKLSDDFKPLQMKIIGFKKCLELKEIYINELKDKISKIESENESQQILEEMGDYQYQYALSEDEGWFYEDDNSTEEHWLHENDDDDDDDY